MYLVAGTYDMNESVAYFPAATTPAPLITAGSKWPSPPVLRGVGFNSTVIRRAITAGSTTGGVEPVPKQKKTLLLLAARRRREEVAVPCCSPPAAAERRRRPSCCSLPATAETRRRPSCYSEPVAAPRALLQWTLLAAAALGPLRAAPGPCSVPPPRARRFPTCRGREGRRG